MTLSVIVCSHNPRAEYLARTLEALRAQTLPLNQWELLLIDNASVEPLEGKWDLSWHPHARHIREDEQGLTPARLRGIRESTANILVFVDDDNVLKCDYLEQSCNLVSKFPFLGAIGGQIIPEYEINPPEWFLPYERVLAIRRSEVCIWSNNAEDWKAQPWGAGLIIRKSICVQYQSNIQSCEVRRRLGRSGKSLLSGEDTDLVLTSLQLDLGFGVFPALVVTHLIPSFRLTEDYLIKITRGLSASHLVVSELHNVKHVPGMKRTWYTELRAFYHFLKRSKLQRRIEIAKQDGIEDGRQLLRKL